MSKLTESTIWSLQGMQVAALAGLLDGTELGETQVEDAAERKLKYFVAV